MGTMCHQRHSIIHALSGALQQALGEWRNNNLRQVELKQSVESGDMNALIKKIRESVIGDLFPVKTPFGVKPLVYADYTASGRSLGFIEDYIRAAVLPLYANTHSESSLTGANTTALREQARQEVRLAVNAAADDQVIFCGSGATSAIHKLIEILNLRLPSELDEQYKLSGNIPAESRPVVFIGPYEHHSNELPWRESIAELVVIKLTTCGQLDLNDLRAQLECYKHRPVKIGSFSAASNVTGIKTNVNVVSALLHSYAALSFWDYAAAAPYLAIDMQGTDADKDDTAMDAIFISPHKFVGGPGTPGILVVGKHVLKNRVPAMPGGGTVVYVTPEDHRYLENHEQREEGGTPAIIESIRAGLVFKLKRTVGDAEIERLESDFVQRALCRWRRCDSIEILGSSDLPRLSIMSLRIKWGDKDLHYGFVVALLNDLFGIQSRGGCSCAGPYGHQLLGMDMAYSRAIEAQIVQSHTILRPGWVRLNFNYFIDEATFEYLLRAIELVAEHGWRLLPYYCFDPHHGVWRYQGEVAQTGKLPDFAELPGEESEAALPEQDLAKSLAEAEFELMRTTRPGRRYPIVLPDAVLNLCWFVLPQDIQEIEPEDRVVNGIE